jgi:hypothetical protein
MDGGELPAPDDVPGGTAMLRPGQALPPPPRKPSSRPVDPVPERPEDVAAVDGGTAVLAPAQQRAAPKKTPPPSRKQSASTNIMTPEESEAAQQQAAAKMEEAQQALVHTRTRDDKRAELAKARSSRAMWIALGGGTLAAVALIVGLMFLFFSEDSGSSAIPKPRRSANLPEAQATPAADPAPAQRNAPAERPEPPRRRVGSRAFGTLTLNPGPNVSVVFGGNELPKQVGAFSLPVTAESGIIEVGDDSTPFRVTLAYAVSGGALKVKVQSSPRALATVNGKTAAAARIDKTMSVVELKRPGGGPGMTVRLGFKPN